MPHPPPPTPHPLSQERNIQKKPRKLQSHDVLTFNVFNVSDVSGWTIFVICNKLQFAKFV